MPMRLNDPVVGSTDGQVLIIDNSGKLSERDDLAVTDNAFCVPAGIYDATGATGNGSVQPASIPGLQVGPNKTGLIYDPSIGHAINFMVGDGTNSRYMGTMWWISGDNVAQWVANATIRPEVTSDYSLGTTNRFWYRIYGKAYHFGRQGTDGYEGRKVYFGHGQDCDAGLGFNFVNGSTGYGNEVFFKGYDHLTDSYVDFINIVQNNKETVISAPLNSNATNPSPGNINGQSFTLKGGSANATSANGGDVVLGGGAGGASGRQGSVYIPTTSGAPSFTPGARTGYAAIYADPTNNKLWMYNGSGWVSTTLS